MSSGRGGGDGKVEAESFAIQGRYESPAMVGRGAGGVVPGFVVKTNRQGLKHILLDRQDIVGAGIRSQ